MAQQLPPLYDQLKVEPDRYIPLEHISYGEDDPHAHLLPVEQLYDANVGQLVSLQIVEFPILSSIQDFN